MKNPFRSFKFNAVFGISVYLIVAIFVFAYNVQRIPPGSTENENKGYALGEAYAWPIYLVYEGAAYLTKPTDGKVEK